MNRKQGKIRVSSDHWKVLLDFAESYPEIITNKFANHLHGKKTNKDIWEQLTIKLNSLGLGQRTVEEWKKTLADWKAKTKTKAAKINKYTQQTGGGPANPVVLNSLEERLLSLMGKTATYGDNTVEEKGLKRKKNDVQDELGKKNKVYQSKEKENIVEHMLLHEQNIIVEEVVTNDHEYFCTDFGENPHIVNTTKEIDQIEVQDTCETNMSSPKTPKSDGRLQKQNKIDANAMHNDVLKVLNNIDTNIGSIAKSFEKLVNHFCK